MSSLGFIGLGSMGGPMARNLVSDGHDLTAFDLDEEPLEAIAEAGATAASSASEAATDAEVVFLSLPGPDNVTAVVDEIEADISEGSILVDLTTSTPGTTNGIAERLEPRGVDVTNELVAAVEREQTLSEKKAKAGIVTRAKWWLVGMDDEE